MKQTVTIEIADNSVLQLLRDLAAMSLVRFTSETPSQDDLIIAQINEVCKEVDTSIDSSLMLAQMEALEKEDW
jgi:hypothetical protein